MQGVKFLQIIVLYVSNLCQILQQVKEIWAFMGLKYSEKPCYMLQPIEVINCGMVVFAGIVKD